VSNKRINYACLALAYCDERPIDGVTSVGLSLSREITNIYGRGKSTPAASYSQLPSIEVSYSSHLTSNGFTGFQNELGLNDFIAFDMMVGDENQILFSGSPRPDIILTSPIDSIRATYLLLSSITYNLSVDGFFSADRTFSGWGKVSNCPAQGRLPVSTSGIVQNRSSFSAGPLPAFLSGTAIQNVKISMNINRSSVGEFATRKPYASYITFPIQTSCTIDTLVQSSLDTYDFNILETACQNTPSYKENLSFGVCNSSITVEQAHLTSFNYSGAEAKISGGNLLLSLTYTGYQSPQNIKPVIYIDEDQSDPCACP
jgi:hypothetical protein